MKKIILFKILLLLILTSCDKGKEYKMKSDFKETYSSIMKDPESYELVSFKVFKKSYELTPENKLILDNFENRKTKLISQMDLIDSIYAVEEIKNKKFGYTGAIVKIKGTNSFNAKITSEHIAYYLGESLTEIDGKRVAHNVFFPY
jgi:hypothetical protein